MAHSGARPLKDPVSLFEDGQERLVERAWAEANGYTLLDLSDDYVPYPFTQEGPHRPNSYRARYIDLANDRTDRDGRPLPPGRQNHLELYGIPPSLGALRRRFLADRNNRRCFEAVNQQAIAALDVPIVYRSGRKAERRFLRAARRWKAAAARLLRSRKLRKAAHVEATKQGSRVLRAQRRAAARLDAILAVQARLACEGLVRPAEPLRAGVVSWYHQKAMMRFERKHMIFGWGSLQGDTRAAMQRTPLENNHRTLMRTLRERVATGLGVIEDGTVPRSWRNSSSAGARDLLGELTQRLAKALGVTTPARGLGFLLKRSATYFRHRWVALRLPGLPAYHGPHMDLRVVINRGDVHYDFPYDDKGRPIPQPKARRPWLALYVHHRERLLPLVRWSTTIGGWRTEVRGGCHYWKYKNSEVGQRLWKYLVAGPVWIPPPGTPPRSLVAKRWVKGKVRFVPKQWEIGPGYQSAYGLVAALHTREIRRRGRVEDEDGGIRTHGSADYMSILGRHSHGCHRLYNHLAVRLVTFLLAHRHHQRMGEQPLKWRFSFTYAGQRIHFSRSHKGYYFRLVPPVGVTVTRGRVLGKAKSPIRRLIPKVGGPGGPGCIQTSTASEAPLAAPRAVDGAAPRAQTARPAHRDPR